jgi:putative Mg2+ transporter-C (MgtC) family protein
MDTFEIVLRLVVAALAGVAIGLNRDLRGKPTGVRTLGLVGLGSCVVVLAVSHGEPNNVGRVIQGIVTGIGFLGAGVIMHNGMGKQVHGLTTAACVWLTACIGAASAVGDWKVLLIGAPLIAAILILGGPFEKWVHGHWPGPERDSSGPDKFDDY